MLKTQKEKQKKNGNFKINQIMQNTSKICRILLYKMQNNAKKKRNKADNNVQIRNKNEC